MIHGVVPIERFFSGVETIRRRVASHTLPVRIDDAEEIAVSLLKQGRILGMACGIICLGVDYAWLIHRSGTELRICRCSLYVDVPAGYLVVVFLKEFSDATPFLP
jgi:hypothetical protein